MFLRLEEFLHKLRTLKVTTQTVTKEGCITLEPPLPYTEFYIAPVKKYDHVYIDYWSIIAKTIVHKVENVLKMLKPKLCLSAHVFGRLLGSVLKERNLLILRSRQYGLSGAVFKYARGNHNGLNHLH